MIVFCNSGPLMALSKIGALDVLFQLFGQVSIPTAVHREVVIEGDKQSYIDARMAEMAIRRVQLIDELCREVLKGIETEH